METHSKTVDIHDLYLDPNNYRFVDHARYAKVHDEDIKKESVQRRTRSFLEGEKRENIRDLLDSFRTNGFLNVDMIQLRPLDGGSYLVIEGNRRVAAFKCLYDDYRAGTEIGIVRPEIFKAIPAEVYVEADSHHQLIIMGLKHISGNKKWAPINQSQMIYDYLLPFQLGTQEYADEERSLVSSLGITLNKLRTGQRAYHFVQAYKASDFGEQFTSDKYSFFEEAVKRPAIRDWLGWNHSTYQCENKVNEERFFAWISQTEESDSSFDAEDADEDGSSDAKRLEPIITKSADIRELAGFIKEESKLQLMEAKRSIYAVLSDTAMSGRASVDQAMKSAADGMNTLARYTDVLDENDYKKLKEISDTFQKIVPERISFGLSKSSYDVKFNIDDIHHFSEIDIKRFKKIHSVHLAPLGRINVLAGPNNSGKTSVLEAIYLLCHGNDINGCLTLSRMRLKGDAVTPRYVNALVADKMALEAVFNGCPVSLEIAQGQDPAADKLDDYLSSIRVHEKVQERHSDDDYRLVMHMYEHHPASRKYEKLVHLCRTSYSSPYCHGKNELEELYDNAIKVKIKGRTVLEEIINFIRKNIDSTVRNIFLGADKRFIVDSTAFKDKNVELSSYGEGVGRFFEIALNIAYCRNGVLLIDEMETAIHYSLLKRVTKFIQSMAGAFNTQIFMTTHSKECIDAFVADDDRNGEIHFFQMNSKSDKVVQIDGESLRNLIDSMDLDIRGDQQ